MIRLENLSKTYARSQREQVCALRNLSFEIAEGEFVVVRGASGSGKSTLLNILGCLDQPTSGAYFNLSICCRGPPRPKTSRSRWSITMDVSTGAARSPLSNASGLAQGAII